MNPNSDLQDHEEDPQARLYFARICIPIPLENTGDPGTNLLAGHTGPQIFPKKNRPASFDLLLWPINCQSATEPKARAWGRAATEEEEAQGSLHPAGLLLKFFFEGCSAFFTVNSVASLVQSDFSCTRHAPPNMQVSRAADSCGRTKLFANRLAGISGPSTPTPAPAPTPLAPATDSACSFDALINF